MASFDASHYEGFTINRPSGTITFLFTDVEGSSRLWDEHPDEMATALRQHDSILRAALEGHGGYIFTTAGDSFSAAFSNPVDAVNAAREIQVGLQSAGDDVGQIKVRIGIHTGLAEERGGDYFGPALNRAARVMAAGHGGQTLASASTERLVRNGLPPDLRLESLGLHRLKDLGEPEQLFQLSYGAPLSFPPLRVIDATPNNLPHLLSSFVGRQGELEALTQALQQSRLITLTGTGGSGKTRLALQLAAETIGNYPSGTWLVELAPLTEPEMVVGAIASAHGVTSAGHEGPGGREGSRLEELIDHIGASTELLILDDCARLVSQVAQVASSLLLACPNLTIVATGLEGLAVAGEVVWRVPPMTLPQSDTDSLSSECLQLFVARAEAVTGRTQWEQAELSAIAEICRRLDGLPLAIELAAARTKVLAPSQIALRLDDRFRLLTGGARTAVARHKTLEATVAWSYDLLDAAEQAMFRRLSVFNGGFSWEIAEQVVRDDSLDDLQLLDVLSSLVDKSMITRDFPAGRFTMFQTLRQYGAQKLDESEEAAALRRKHLEVFLDRAQLMDQKMLSADEMEARRWFTSELPNIREAVTFGLAEPESVPQASALITATAWYLRASGNEDVLAQVGAEAIAQINLVDSRQSALLCAATALALAALGNVDEATGLAGRAREFAAKVDDAGAKAEAALALDAATEGETTGAELRDLIAEIIRYAADYHPYWVGTGYLMLAMDARESKDLAAAEEAARRCEAAFREAGAPSGIAWGLWIRATVFREQGDFTAELKTQQEALRIYEEIGNRPGATVSRQGIALALSYLDRHDEAVQVVEELMTKSPARPSLRDNLANRRRMARIHRRAGLADRLCEDTREILQIVDSELTGTFHLTVAIESVLIDGQIARDERLARLFGWYDAAAATLDRTIPSVEQPRVDETRAALDALLGSERSTTLAAEGASLSARGAVALATSLVEDMCG